MNRKKLILTCIAVLLVLALAIPAARGWAAEAKLRRRGGRKHA